MYNKTNILSFLLMAALELQHARKNIKNPLKDKIAAQFCKGYLTMAFSI